MTLRTVAARWEAPAYAILRVVSGGLLAFHGLQKIFHVRAEFAPAVGSQIWIGGLIELFGGLLIALGLFTRPAAFLTCGMMAVAYFQFHWKLAFADGLWLPAINKGELAVVYCFIFLYVWAKGGGPFSLDARRSGVKTL